VRKRAAEIKPEDPHDLAAQMLRYLQWLFDRAYSDSTIYGRRLHLARFLGWCRERGMRHPSELTRSVLELYQRHLAHVEKEDGSALSLQTQENYLVAVRGLCRWLARSKLVLYDPSAELMLPRLSDRVPRSILTREEVERVLNTPPTSTPLGIRDRAMLETLYSTGMRRAELARLAVPDLDVERGTVLIREGKYRKDRVVPIGERALRWTAKYLGEVRPEYVVPPDEGFVFLTRHGRGFVPNGVSELVTRVVKASGIGKSASAHSFRHTMATVMLEGGADIRYIQQMLGHSSLTTTEVYTRVSIRALKEVHDRTHPSARLRRKRGSTIVLDEDEEDGDGEGEE
jgi:integrase/recombinase XerD